MKDATRWQGFFVKPSGEIEEIDASGDNNGYWTEGPSFYETLILGGYPASNSDSHMSDWIDLSVDPDAPTAVTVYTEGAGAHEHAMGPASELFLHWYRQMVTAAR